MLRYSKNFLLLTALLAIIIFSIMVISLSSIKIDKMGTDEFFVVNVLPVTYWIGISIILFIAFFSLKYINNNRSIYFYFFIVLLLLTSFKMAFPLMFTSIPAYEPDAVNYLKIVTSWTQNGIDFGSSGNYEHDYPLAFLLAFSIIKLGVPIGGFFIVAPFVIYGLITLLLYLIVSEIVRASAKLSSVSIYLFSFSSLGYWISVHYCPDLLGSLFYFLALYLTIRFAKAGEWSFKTISPLLISVMFLVLSHHLSTLYFVITVLGLALSTSLIKNNPFKGKAISFLIVGIFAYTFWFTYGNIFYPEFFNFSSYFSGYGSTTQLIQDASLLSRLTFLVYPLFILGLFSIQVIKVLQFKGISDLPNLKTKIKNILNNESNNAPILFAGGFIIVVFMFIIGFPLAVAFPTRVLEVILIGLYPLSSQGFLSIYENKRSKRSFILFILFLILLIVMITDVYRYYSQIQNRVLFS